MIFIITNLYGMTLKMPLSIDYPSRLVLITAPDTEISAQALHDFIEDEMASPLGLLSNGTAPFYGDIIVPEGKVADPNNPGIFSQIIIKLNLDWQIQFWQGSGYSRFYGGKIVGGFNGQPFKATGAAGDLTVIETPVDGVTVVTGSSITEQDKDDIAEKSSLAVWDDPDAIILKANVSFIKAVEGGRWKIDTATNQMFFYADDNTTEVARFDLKDEAGNPTSEMPYERIRA